MELLQPRHLGQLHQTVFNLLMYPGSLSVRDLKRAIRAARNLDTDEAVNFVVSNLHGHADEKGKEFLKRVCRLRFRS